MRLSDAVSVNTLINNGVAYRTNQAQFGVPQYWTVAQLNGYGDCKAISLAKRQRLLDAGWSRSDACLIVCTDEHGDGHCVLAVRTDGGWVILDNRTMDVRKPAACPYKWFSILRNGRWWRLYWFLGQPVTLIPTAAPVGWADFIARNPSDPDSVR